MNEFGLHAALVSASYDEAKASFVRGEYGEPNVILTFTRNDGPGRWVRETVRLTEISEVESLVEDLEETVREHYRAKEG